MRRSRAAICTSCVANDDTTDVALGMQQDASWSHRTMLVCALVLCCRCVRRHGAKTPAVATMAMSGHGTAGWRNAEDPH